LLVTPVIAQEPADENNSLLFLAPYPEDGTWITLDNSNTGFFMDIQNGIVGGAYFGFDADGDTVWLLFNGQLEPVVGDSGFVFGWRLDTTLTRSQNGGCIIDCTTSNDINPSSAAVGNLTIDFFGRSTGSFAIDGAVPADIISFSFGTSGFTIQALTDVIGPFNAPASFPEILTDTLPDIEGKWLVAGSSAVLKVSDLGLEIVSLVNIEEVNTSGLIDIGPQQVVTDPDDNASIVQIFAPIVSDPGGLFPPGSLIQCTFELSINIGCIVTSDDPIDPGVQAVSIGTTLLSSQMTDSRFLIYNIAPDDDVADSFPIQRFEAFRLGYD